MLKIIIPAAMLLFLPNTINKSFHQAWMMCLIFSFCSLMLIPTNFSFLPLAKMMSLDLMSSTLITLSLWISALMVIASYSLLKMKKAPKMFISTTIALMIILVMTFSVNSFIMFYVLFEASLIPTFILIILWGYQPERLNAGFYLMLYTITASLPLLIGLLLLYKNSFHFSMILYNFTFFIGLESPVMQFVWLMMTLAFLVKMPLYLMHLWLPKAHVEAPVAGSMVLAGILLKLGSYGLIRVSSIMQVYSTKIMPAVSSVALVGAFITGFICVRQHHIKSLIAYSSVGHMGLLTAGLMSCNMWGWQGSLALMIAHGLCSSCLFAMANMFYEFSSTQSIFLTKGIMTIFPASTFWFFMANAGNMAAPPSLNLIGEILLLTSILSYSFYLWILVGMASFLSAAYSLFLYTSTHHGPMPNFMNPIKLFMNRNYSVCLLHLAPLFLMSLKAELISLWI